MAQARKLKLAFATCFVECLAVAFAIDAHAQELGLEPEPEIHRFCLGLVENTSQICPPNERLEIEITNKTSDLQGLSVWLGPQGWSLTPSIANFRTEKERGTPYRQLLGLDAVFPRQELAGSTGGNAIPAVTFTTIEEHIGINVAMSLLTADYSGTDDPTIASEESIQARVLMLFDRELGPCLVSIQDHDVIDTRTQSPHLVQENSNLILQESVDILANPGACWRWQDPLSILTRDLHLPGETID